MNVGRRDVLTIVLEQPIAIDEEYQEMEGDLLISAATKLLHPV